MTRRCSSCAPPRDQTWAGLDASGQLRFYTDVLGFVKKSDIPMGEHAWLTVVSPDDPDGTELVLEPSDHPTVPPFNAALVHDGIPSRPSPWTTSPASNGT